jgi:hypothetical protein
MVHCNNLQAAKSINKNFNHMKYIEKIKTIRF